MPSRATAYTHAKRDKGLCQNCVEPRVPGKSKCQRHLDYFANFMKAKRARLKARVFEHYGAVCACCGLGDRRFLSVDHKNNDGGERRKISGPASIQRYNDVIRRGFPDDIQILCFNCNFGRAQNSGVCPHKEMV